MRRSGEAPKALTYKVLVRAFWEEGKVNEAVEVVRDMERRGVVGIASVYYELACCLCNNGRWQDAIVEVEKLKKRPHSKPLEVTFTGMITSSMDGGHLDDCLSIFEHMKYHCSPNIGTINAMLKVYGRNDMFSKAKELFEETKRSTFASNTCMDDGSISLEMTLSGYQLDQSKHALLLGKASRAGKWHLLEHAFDTILEAGEIPHPSIFTEMICQATAQHNYERAVTLINAMAHAPFVVSEKQWTDLFSEEATVSNLYKSLQSLCGSGTSMDQSSVAFGDEAMIRTPLNGNSGELDDNKKVFFQKFSADARGSDLSPHENPPVKNSDVTFDIFSVNLTRSEEEDDDTDGEAISEAFNYACNGDEVASNEPNTLDGNSEGINKIELNMRAKEDDSHGSNLPSANEILETWKKSRERDGIFFPFQLGQKLLIWHSPLVCTKVSMSIYCKEEAFIRLKHTSLLYAANWIQNGNRHFPAQARLHFIAALPTTLVLCPVSQSLLCFCNHAEARKNRRRASRPHEARKVRLLHPFQAQTCLNKYGPAVSGLASADSASAGSGSAPADAKAAEKTAFDIKLEKFDAAAKIKIIKEVRTFTDLGLKEAKDLVEKAPVVLKKGVTKEEGNPIVEKLKELGATVEFDSSSDVMTSDPRVLDCLLLL
ncbi:Pentatricopeptide repeat-containing protein, chloroplastic [Vitis vinifera]|uniref:Pentatricopeptide repeat-containing protein, chloroplastic n=1 Tax=Vitis vinifera TaxID=29760 RepID=A0A438FBM9_VITVI|nr:Pentatricopeptide repeat-containing protein, chloroplastic [Vitis vinifera]